jgi:hypothetical protein
VFKILISSDRFKDSEANSSLGRWFPIWVI